MAATTMRKKITPKRRGQRGASAIVQIIARGAFRGRCCSKYTPCTDTGISGGGGGGLTVSGNFVFLTPSSGNVVKACGIATNGALGTCVSSTVSGAATGSSISTAIYGQNLYTITTSDVDHCAINTSTGAVSSCAISDGGATFSQPGGVAIY